MLSFGPFTFPITILRPPAYLNAEVKSERNTARICFEIRIIPLRYVYHIQIMLSNNRFKIETNYPAVQVDTLIIHPKAKFYS